MDRFKAKIMTGGLLSQIIQPITDWYELFKSEAYSALRAELPFLDKMVVDGVINFQGKHLRPILTMLIAKTFGREDIDNIISSAVSVELVHMASLIHDDVLDEASVRHNVPTPNCVVGSHAAVLTGDYVLAKGVHYPISKGNIRAVNLLVQTMEQLVEGELLQKAFSENLDIDKEGYFKVISLKTSCLIAVAARLGASVQYNSLMEDLGQNIGAAFQIKDDMLDIWNTTSGKCLYNDFKERKITLPLIFAMENNQNLQKKIKLMLSSGVDDEVALELADIVKKSDALIKLNDVLADLQKKATDIVRMFPDSEARDALFNFVNFVTSRDF